MATRFLLAVLGLLAWIGVAEAQSTLTTPPKGPTGQQQQPPALQAPIAPLRKGECGLLPGGKAPVAAIAELPTPMSVRSLDLVYFGKRLADLTQADFQRIAELSKRCAPGEGILPQDKIAKLQQVVFEAQRARQVALNWGKERMAEIGQLPSGRPRLVRLNDLWLELEAHEPELIRDDVDGFAAWIAREQQAIYDAAPRWQPNRPAIAVMPAAPLPGAARAASASGTTPIFSAGHSRQQGGEED